MGLISLVPEPHTFNHLKVTGFSSNVRRVTKMIEFYNEYISKLGSLEQKYRQEKLQFESEKLSFAVP